MVSACACTYAYLLSFSDTVVSIAATKELGPCPETPPFPYMYMQVLVSMPKMLGMVLYEDNKAVP